MNLAQALLIDGWMTEPELRLLAFFASTRKRIVEVGSYCGRSTRVLADNTKGQVVAIDPWDGMCQTYGMITYSNGYLPELAEFERRLEDHLESSKVLAIRNKFLNVKELPFEPDMIFLDAIHEYPALRDDIMHARKFMKKGLLCGHDFSPNWPGVIRAVTEIFPHRSVRETIWYVEL